MKKYLFPALPVVFLVLIGGCTQQGQAGPKGIAIYGSGGSGMLIAQCSEKPYIEENSDHIVEGVVQKSVSNWNARNTAIITNHEFYVEKYSKGSDLGRYLNLEIPGGCVKGTCMAVEDQAILESGKRLRLYFKMADGVYQIVCGNFGVEEV